MEGIDYGKSAEIMTQFDVVHGPYRVDALQVSPGDKAASKLEIVGLWVSGLTAVPDGCADAESTSHAFLMPSCLADYVARPARYWP